MGRAKVYNSDTVHPNDFGHEYMSIRVRAGLERLKYPKDMALLLDFSREDLITESSGLVSAVAGLTEDLTGINQSIGSFKPTTGVQTINNLNALGFSGLSAAFLIRQYLMQMDFYHVFACNVTDNATNKTIVNGSTNSVTVRLNASENIQIVQTGTAVKVDL